MSRPPEGMAGLAKGLAVLEAFGPGRTQLTVTEAARAAGMTPAAARRCLLTLQSLGYLTHDGKFFRPSPRMLRLGAAYLETVSLPQLARPHVLAARDELGESVSLAVWEDGASVFVARAEVARIVNTGVRLGARLEAWASATGRVLLAGMPAQETEAYLASVSPQATTPNTVVGRDALRARVALARQEGAAITDEELELGMRTLAVPVRDAGGRVHAAMASSAFTARVTLEEMRERFVPVLRRHADQLGRML